MPRQLQPFVRTTESDLKKLIEFGIAMLQEQSAAIDKLSWCDGAGEKEDFRRLLAIQKRVYAMIDAMELVPQDVIAAVRTGSPERVVPNVSTAPVGPECDGRWDLK